MRASTFCIAAIGALALVIACDKRPEPSLMEERVRAILELPTYEQIYRDVVFVDRERSFLVFRTMHAQVLFSIEIRVKAGFDLSDGLSLTSGSNSTVLVGLPPAQVLLVDADEATIEQYFVKEIGGNIERLEYYDEINRIKEEIVADAIQRDILVKATDNAQGLITQILLAAGYEEVRFVEL